MVECLTRDPRAAGSSLTGIVVQDPSLVLVQPRRTRPCLTERLLMGCNESNQTNKSLKSDYSLFINFSSIH